ncbi:sulfotransferase family cytosolic 1B member 1-like [Sitophilus oryzae]|uniref:Sulfotransferase family cytosolic 1B member 1-like n=1 Tax=Sitophilus oryzae TaxID=7048 RepID=A0A6J2XFM1_SITOR|nr:sulfotransferase family cytosolic 1B member 1-like [Sitophilus oryzae]
MVVDTMETMENDRHDALLNKYFVNRFRKGYVTVDGVTMPVRFKELQENILNWNVNEQDVWICSFPKTGTTWTQEMVWMILNDLDFEGGQVNLGARSPFLEVSALFDYRDLMRDVEGFDVPPFLNDSLKFVQNQKSPVCIKTHLPFNLLPKAIQDGTKRPKIIYIARNPKDTCLSYYHHAKLLEGYTGDFETFCRLFLANKLCFAPYWKHLLQFWNRRHEDNVLFLRYEDMKKDLPSAIRATAKFLEKDLNENQVDILTDHLSFDSMKKNPAVNYELVTELNKKYKLIEQEGMFMRSGSVGGYKTVMSPELIEEFDRWIRTNTKNTDFQFY